ncbi:MAG: DUF1036 domain-containing protein [Alphaproteobacteria bacterium]|nr:MAG: DUF1036 domain-containing protein [Alphaproteobacteria bacterium]
MSKAATRKKAVTTGIVPAIRALLSRRRKEDVDGRAFAAPKGLRPRRRVKPRHDEPKPRQPRSRLTRLLMALPAAVLSFLASSAPAFADLKLCNRMSYVVEAAIGIDDKAATATRGWFRIDPAACRVVMQGTLAADRILLHARALGVYGASPIPQNGSDTLCVAPDNFVIAAARQCRSGQTPVPFTQITPTRSDDGNLVAYLAEDSEYDDEQARLAGIQRLLVIAGYDAAPIDGVDGPKTQAALAAFLKSRALTVDIVQSPNFFAAMIDAVQSPSSTGLTWCNDTRHKIMAAVATDDGKTVVSRGWYRIDPGKCLHPDVTGQPKQIFSFAEAVDADNRTIRLKDKPLNWGGATQLCTRESKFETNEQGDCTSRGFATTGFAAVDMSGGGNTLRFAMP